MHQFLTRCAVGKAAERPVRPGSAGRGGVGLTAPIAAVARLVRGVNLAWHRRSRPEWSNLNELTGGCPE